jgi:serine protease Do
VTAEEIINELKPCIVLIRAGKATGTGILASREGHVLTCNHVAGTDLVEVLSHDNRSWTVPVLGREPTSDLAMLQLNGVETEPIVFADPAGISEGQTVLALGHPMGFSFTVSRGVVSSRSRTVQGTTYVQTDVALNPGNSGGPVVNEKGEAIGVADWIIAEGRGLGFAIALRHVFAFAARLRVRLIRANAFPFGSSPP